MQLCIPLPELAQAVTLKQGLGAVVHVVLRAQQHHQRQLGALAIQEGVNTVAAMGLVLAVLLACSGHLAFQLRYNAGRTGRKTARVGATAGGSSASRAAEAGRYTHLGVFPEAEEAIQLSEITESRMH